MQNPIPHLRLEPALLRHSAGDECPEQGTAPGASGALAQTRNGPASQSYRGAGQSQVASTEIVLTLPYPVSANRYWRTGVVNRAPVVYVSREARLYREQVVAIARQAGISKPLSGRIEFSYRLFPKQPKDWARRCRANPCNWDDTVGCLDLDNAQKVLIDALKGVAFDDDKWIRKIQAERAQPDGEARVEVRIRQYQPESEGESCA